MEEGIARTNMTSLPVRNSMELHLPAQTIPLAQTGQATVVMAVLALDITIEQAAAKIQPPGILHMDPEDAD